MNKIIQLFTLNEDYSNRIFGLDLLRFFAIFFVMHDHGSRFVPKAFLDYYNFIRYDGVGVFFVLSGFLIGGILLKQLDKYKFNLNFLFDFWIRRWMRTLPNYFLFLVSLLILYSFIYNDFEISSHLNYFIFFQNIYSGKLDFFGESWSLAVEEWFYLSLPILMLTLGLIIKSQKIILFISIILILIVCNYFRYCLFMSNNDYEDINHSVLGRLDSIIYGVLGAYLCKNYKTIWVNYKLFFLILGVCLIFSTKIIHFSEQFNFQFKSTLISITILFILPFFNEFKQLNNKIISKFIINTSLISYSIYLVNSQVSNFLVRGINWNSVVNNIQSYLGGYQGTWSIFLVINFFLFFLLTFLISSIIYKYYEVPMTKLRDLPFFKNRFKKELK